jgi:Flp pilus assembly protein TadG
MIGERTDRGSVTVFIAVLAVAFLAAAGLAVDGGRKLGGLSEARDLADNAARTCAQAVDAAAYRSTGVPSLDESEATGRADAYLADTGHGGSVSVDDTTCTVTVTLSVPTRFLPGPYVVSATESAEAVSGIEGAAG